MNNTNAINITSPNLNTENFQTESNKTKNSMKTYTMEVNNMKEASSINKDFIKNNSKAYYYYHNKKSNIDKEKITLNNLGIADDKEFINNNIKNIDFPNKSNNIFNNPKLNNNTNKYLTPINLNPGPGTYNIANEFGIKEKDLLPYERYFIFQRTMYNERIKLIYQNLKSYF